MSFWITFFQLVLRQIWLNFPLYKFILDVLKILKTSTRKKKSKTFSTTWHEYDREVVKTLDLVASNLYANDVGRLTVAYTLFWTYMHTLAMKQNLQHWAIIHSYSFCRFTKRVVSCPSDYEKLHFGQSYIAHLDNYLFISSWEGVQIKNNVFFY